MNAPPDRRYLWLFALLAVLGLTADQASKYGIFAWLYSDGTPRADETVLGTFALDTKIAFHAVQPRDPYSTRELKLLPGVFDIVASHTPELDPGDGVTAALRPGGHRPYVNRGALFGWGNASDGGDLNTPFGVVSLLAALGIAYWCSRPATRGDRVLCAALGLVLAGTLGNLYDRVVFGGVRDFLHWYKWYDWPVFNVADCCLVCGAGLLLAHAFFTAEDRTGRTVADAQVPATTDAGAAGAAGAAAR